MGRRHLHRRASRGCCCSSAISATGSDASACCRSASSLFAVASFAWAALDLDRPAHRGPRGDGRGVALVYPSTLALLSTSSPTARRRPSPSASGPAFRPGHRARPGARRLAAGALLVGIDLHGQPSGRRRRAPARRDPDARSQRPGARPVRRVGAGSPSPSSACSSGRSSRRRRGWTSRATLVGFAGSAALLVIFVWWEVAPRPTRCWTSASSATPGSRRRARPSRWRSSASSGSSS